MLRDPLEQVELINQAQHFMCPTKMLHANPMYANHLPTIHTRKHAVKDILNSLKFFHDLRNVRSTSPYNLFVRLMAFYFYTRRQFVMIHCMTETMILKLL